MYSKRLFFIFISTLVSICACDGSTDSTSNGPENQASQQPTDQQSTDNNQTVDQTTIGTSAASRIVLPNALQIEDTRLSDSARYAFFTSAGSSDNADTSVAELKLYDRDLNQTNAATIARDGESINGSSEVSDISADGQRRLFQSYATNLLGAESIGKQLFLYDNASGTNILLTRNTQGASAAGQTRNELISANGEVITFISNADDLTAEANNDSFNVYRYDISRSQLRRISFNAGAQADVYVSDQVLDISSNGNLILYALIDDAEGTTTLYVYDSATESTDSLPLNEIVITASISDDGKFIAYAGRIDGVDTVRVLEIETGRTTSLDSASLEGLFPVISRNGKQVAYLGTDSDLFAAQVYLADLVSGDTVLISQSPAGQPGNGRSFSPHFTANGSHLYFASMANNLVASDTNSEADVFLYELN